MSTEEKQNQQKTKEIELPTPEEMLKAGVHFGHQTTKWNPKMEPYIFTVKNNVHIIDLEKTVPKLKEALDFLREIVTQEGIVLFVGTSPAAKKVTKDAALKCQMPYISERWIGGTLTNFKVISKRLEYFRDLENKKESGELKKYTKKEQHEFDKELTKLEKRFGGIKKMTKIPEALFIFDAKENSLAIKEAKRTGVKIVALCDTNVDPKDIDYPIPSNDDAISSLELLAGYIVKAINKDKEK